MFPTGYSFKLQNSIVKPCATKRAVALEANIARAPGYCFYRWEIDKRKFKIVSTLSVTVLINISRFNTKNSLHSPAKTRNSLNPAS